MPVRATSGNRGTPPDVIAKIQEYGPGLSASRIRIKLVEDGTCTYNTVPCDSTINKYKKCQGEDGAQRPTGRDTEVFYCPGV